MLLKVDFLSESHNISVWAFETWIFLSYSIEKKLHLIFKKLSFRFVVPFLPPMAVVFFLGNYESEVKSVWENHAVYFIANLQR